MASFNAFSAPRKPFFTNDAKPDWADCKVGVPGQEDRAARPDERVCQFREIKVSDFYNSMNESIKCLADGLDATRLRLGTKGRELKYEVGGRMKRHTDRMSRSGDLVKFATVVVLHPGEYEGGHLVLYDGKREIARYTADKENYTIVMFWSNMFHEVTEVTEGTRFASVFPVFRDESLKLTERTVQFKPFKIKTCYHSNWDDRYGGKVRYTGSEINDELKIIPGHTYKYGYWYKGCKNILKSSSCHIVLTKGTVRTGDQEWTSDGETWTLINGFSYTDEIHVSGDFFTYNISGQRKVSQNMEPTPSTEQLILDEIKEILEDMKGGKDYRGFARIAELQNMADAEEDEECEYCALIEGLEKNPLSHSIPVGYERPSYCTCEEEEDEEEEDEEEEEDLKPVMLPLGTTSGVYYMSNLYTKVPENDGSDLIGQDRAVYDQVRKIGYRVKFEIRAKDCDSSESARENKTRYCVNKFGSATFNDEIYLEFDDGSDFDGTIYQRQWVMVYW